MRGRDRTLLKPFICPVCKGDPIGMDPVWGIYYYPPHSCVYCNEEGVVGLGKFLWFWFSDYWIHFKTVFDFRRYKEKHNGKD